MVVFSRLAVFCSQRKQQETNRLAKQHKEENPPSIFKMKEFTLIPSKVADDMKCGTPSPQTVDGIAPRMFLQKGQGQLSAAAEKSPAKVLVRAPAWDLAPVGDTECVPENARKLGRRCDTLCVFVLCHHVMRRQPPRAVKPPVPTRDSIKATSPRTPPVSVNICL